MSELQNRDFQKLAIDVARQSRQEKEPNLFVGAVIVKDGEMLVTGSRGQLGLGEHAEYTALKILKEKNLTAANSTIYTTLEPCTFRETATKMSCAERLIEQRVRTVFVGAVDPNISIRGGGIKWLQAAGIEVQLFDHDFVKEIYAMNGDFEKFHARAPGRLAPKVDTLHRYREPDKALIEYLRLENLYFPMEIIPAIFDAAIIHTDEAMERIGWDVLVIKEDRISEIEGNCRQFASECGQVIRKYRLGRYYLAVVFDIQPSSRGDELVSQLQSMCSKFQPPTGIKILAGYMAHRMFIGVVTFSA